jgi:hypothetical protein
MDNKSLAILVALFLCGAVLIALLASSEPDHSENFTGAVTFYKDMDTSSADGSAYFSD